MTIDEAIEKYKIMSIKGNVMFPQRPDIAVKSDMQYEQTYKWLEELKQYKGLQEGNEELIKALRCSASPKNSDCGNCKYRYLEEVSDKIPCPPDCEIDGVKYWKSCDFDRIVLEAADAIERLSKLKEH